MFSQLFVIAIGCFLIFIGATEGRALEGALGVVIVLGAAHTLFKLKTGSALTIGGFKNIDEL